MPIITDEKGRFMPYEPTDTNRAEVKALVSFGNTQIEIAKYLNISDETLRIHYRRELDTAAIQANAAVARRLYQKAVEQDDLSAQIFWLKTRGRWRTIDNEIIINNNSIEDIQKHAERIKAAEKDY